MIVILSTAVTILWVCLRQYRPAGYYRHADVRCPYNPVRWRAAGVKICSQTDGKGTY
jgi:hypothetical protein